MNDIQYELLVKLYYQVRGMLRNEHVNETLYDQYRDCIDQTVQKLELLDQGLLDEE